MRVDILLSTYNSEVHLEELLNSLLAQTFQAWTLLVRDDLSTDGTLLLLEQFSKKHSIPISIIDNEKKRLGPKKSFEKLLEMSSADYMLFCDHDDYWLPHKVEDSLREIQKLEAQHPHKAALVFTDLKVVDHTLKPISSSFWNYSKVNPNNIYNSYKLLINNPAPGCTFIINQATKKLVMPFPEAIRMHDWWLALKVSESGVASFLAKPSILYRQHKNNKIGAEPINKSYLKKRLFTIKETWKNNKQSYTMMKCLQNDYHLYKLLYHKVIISFSKFF